MSSGKGYETLGSSGSVLYPSPTRVAATPCGGGWANLDTTTGAPASGPALLPEPEPETPGRRRRRPALRHSISRLVPVSRCARGSLALVFRRVFPPPVRERCPS